MDIQRWHLIAAHDAVSIKIPLFHTAIAQGDVPVQKCGEAQHCATLHLRHYRVGCAHSAAAGGNDDALDAQLALRVDGDLGNLGRITSRAERQRNAAPSTWWQRPIPLRKSSRRLKHMNGAGMSRQKRFSIGNRVLLESERKFVEEAFHWKRVLHVPNASPEACGETCRRLAAHIVNMQVGEIVGGPLHR